MTSLMAFLIGSAMGSLSNVFIFRVPRRMSLTKPRHSICSTCKSRLTTLEMLPVISYVLIRGRCRHCKEKIPSRYLTVELIQGGIWTAIWMQFLVANWNPEEACILTVTATLALICLFGAFEMKEIRQRGPRSISRSAGQIAL
jgi:prepilin signal peptidase PulO-like enzyme (type II secretory pathway)